MVKNITLGYKTCLNLFLNKIVQVNSALQYLQVLGFLPIFFFKKKIKINQCQILVFSFYHLKVETVVLCLAPFLPWLQRKDYGKSSIWQLRLSSEMYLFFLVGGKEMARTKMDYNFKFILHFWVFLGLFWIFFCFVFLNSIFTAA